MTRFYTFLSLFLLSIGTKGVAQTVDAGVIYYKETINSFEQIAELPRDTVRDTVFISDLNAFFKQYYNKDLDLRTFTNNLEALKSTVDSLNGITGERLYYNYFLRIDTARKLSNSFVIKEFKMKEKTGPDSIQVVSKKVEVPSFIHPDSVSREVLFRCEGAALTDRFLNNPEEIKASISAIFTGMQQDGGNIKAINLYFPDFSFKEERAMAQFVKSVRIIMDASKRFKFGPTSLHVIFHKRKDHEAKMDKDFQYCLMQDASEVLFVDPRHVAGNYFVSAEMFTREELTEVGFFTQLVSHFKIARYYTKDLNIRERNLTSFSKEDIAELVVGDYHENNWEIYFFILIGIIILALAATVLYYFYLPFSTLVNENRESVVLISIVVLLEVLALIISIFQYMSTEDSFTILSQNPVMIFALPLVVVLVVPILYGLSKKGRTP